MMNDVSQTLICTHIVIDDLKIVLEKTDALCVHALSSLLHYALVLERGGDPVELDFSKQEDKEHAYIQCVDSDNLPRMEEQRFSSVTLFESLSEMKV